MRQLPWPLLTKPLSPAEIVMVTNATIANNTAATGSGTYKGVGTFRIQNTIVSGNSGGNGAF